MIPTDGRTLYDGDIATYWIEDGILYSQSKSVLRTVKNISDNIAFVQRITNNKKMPLLIYLVNSPVPDKATRKLSTQLLPTAYSAMAMVSDGALAKLIMNLLFKFQTPPIPMKSFSNDAEAKLWLQSFR
jgi:hypothetical protein